MTALHGFPLVVPGGVSDGMVARKGLFAFIMIPLPCSSHVAYLVSCHDLCVNGVSTGENVLV